MISGNSPVQFVRPKKPVGVSRPSGFESWLLALLLGLAVFATVAILAFFAIQLVYIGRILPGVQVAGVQLGGMNRPQAAQALANASTFATLGQVKVTDGAKSWLFKPADLGLSLDMEQTTSQAMSVGRAGGPLVMVNDLLNALQVGVAVPPVVWVNQGVAASQLRKIDAEVALPATEAALRLNGTQVEYAPGQAGSGIDMDASLALITAQLQTFRDGEVTLRLGPRQPMVAQAEDAAEQARQLMAGGVTVALPNAKQGDPGPWMIPPDQLAPMLRFVRTENKPGATYKLAFDQDSLRAWLERTANEVDRIEGDARFIFDLASQSLVLTQPSHNGYQLNISETVSAFQQAIAGGQAQLQLAVKVTPPQVSDEMTAAQLGITQLTQSYTSHFYGSSADRRQNIRTAAANFNGVLVPPDSVFSMGKYMSDVSLENGYAEALIIYNGKTIKGVGGGVCQVSTTLFRTAFYAGYQITERHAHAYRVLYYEQSPNGANDPLLSGFDATVYFPLVDFKFKNDSPYWILMETVYDDAGSSLTWNFYSTPDGRNVEAVFSGPLDIKPVPPPVVTFNPEAEPYSITRLDYPAEGARVVINRTVFKNGAVLFSDDFATVYQPWAEACEYGPEIEDVEKALQKKGWCQPVE